MEKERTTDKRKAQDKDTSDDVSSDITQGIKNPTKRPRVDIFSSGEDESANQKGQQDLNSPSNPVPGKKESNGDVTALAGNNTDVISKNKFDLPTPFTSQELAQKIGSNNCENADSDEDGSTKFLSDIIQNEKSRKAKAKTNGSPVSKPRRNGGSTVTTTSTSASSQHPPLSSSSPVSDLAIPPQNTEVEVTISIRDPVTGQAILDNFSFRSDCQRTEAFLRQHNIQVSSQSSGYLGDISSSDNSAGAGHLQGSRPSRWTISSLGSTIPRESLVSIATDMSESPDEIIRKNGGKVPSTSKARKGKDGPVMSSTKIFEDTDSSNGGRRVPASGQTLVNGDGKDARQIGKPQSPSKTALKKVQGPLASARDEGIGSSITGTPTLPSTPGFVGTPQSVKGRANNTPVSSAIAKSGGERSAARKRRVGSANNFPITSVETPPEISAVLNQPRPARGVAKIEGTGVRPLSKFEQEMNNEPVIHANLEKSGTLYSTILPEEPVFARWRDRNYYSGVIKSKGLNDTWVIDFDDGMEDVASETHIIPLRILGVGLKGIYSPDETYKPVIAEIVGQKFVQDKEAEVTNVKYAIKFEEKESGDTKLMYCSRRQLVLKEADAKKLRPEMPGVAKPGDVSLDNIVSGPRRRAKGGESEGSGAIGSKLIAGAFDVSSSEIQLESSTPTGTPKPRKGARGSKTTPATEAKKSRSTNAATPQTKEKASPGKDGTKLSPTKELVEKEPVRKLKTSLEIGKKKNIKVLFQKMEFFLTAAGGGDPGISGPQADLNTYDKDDLREQIENCGGKVVDQVGDETGENVFLISDGYARTVKYIYSLASGVPCVCHTWIQQCLDMNEIVDWSVFILPAGWSLERQDVIPHHSKKPLKDFKIFVTSESDQLFNYWKPVLVASEAVLLKPPRKKGQLIPNGTQVVVTDNHSESTKKLLDEAEEMKVPVVKPEWLVQTIIVGERAFMYGHEKYRVYFDESETVTETTTDSDIINDPANDILQRMGSPD